MNNYKLFKNKLLVDTENGKIIRLPKMNIVGNPNAQGYLQLDLEGKHYLAHRIIYQVHHGLESMPSGENGKKLVINHINGNRADNRIENLELVPQKKNCTWQTVIRKDNTTGYKGVSYDKKREGYHSYLTVNGKRKYLGFYSTAEEAAAVYQNEVNKNNIHQPSNGCEPEEKRECSMGPDLKYECDIIDGKRFVYCIDCDKFISYRKYSEHLKTKKHLTTFRIQQKD